MKYDVIVIGGGPAGMMAAISAAKLGAKVCLVEKNNRLGVKLLLTGGGRCNITNRTDHVSLVKKFGPNGKFLFSALAKFGVEETIAFFKANGLDVNTEIGGRVFPATDNAQDVLAVLLTKLNDLEVTILTHAEVKGLAVKNQKIEKAILSSGQELSAGQYLITTGGKSYPATGSTGDAYAWLNDLGHRIVEPKPTISPVLVKEALVADLEGVSFDDLRVVVYGDGKKLGESRGQAVITSEGLSGPLIFNLNGMINRSKAEVFKLRLDLKPEIEFADFRQYLQEYLRKNQNKNIGNLLAALLPPKLTAVVGRLSGIARHAKANEVTKEGRMALVRLMKEFELTVKGLAGWEKAMVTTGGVALSEVDPKTMKSNIIHNLFFAGEILDLDAPTGGYNLQAAWSTGFTAGEAAAKE